MALWWRHRPPLRLDRRESPPEAGERGCALPSTRLGPSMSRWKIPPCSMENSDLFDGTQPRPMEGDCSLFSSHDRTSSNIIEKNKKGIHHKQLPPRARAAGLRPVLPRAARRRQRQGARARARVSWAIDRSTYVSTDRSTHTYRSIDVRCITIDWGPNQSRAARMSRARACVVRRRRRRLDRSPHHLTTALMALSVSLPLTFDVAPPSPKHSTSLLFSPLLSSSLLFSPLLSSSLLFSPLPSSSLLFRPPGLRRRCPSRTRK